MTLSRRRVPPLSPVLLAGLALGPVPPLFLLPALSAAHAVMRRRHSGVFERLAELGDALFAIDPVDLPMVFLLRPGGDRPGLRAARDGAEATATIRGPLLALIDLLESGHLWAAALDTVDGEYEPSFADRFGASRIAAYARANDNLVLTPHIGGSTVDAWRETQLRVVERAIEALGACGQ